MNYSELAVRIVDEVGGKENIESYTHCMTRLRFVLKDANKANDKEIKALDEVAGLVFKGGQYQIIIGPEVRQVYDETKKLIPDTKQETEVVEKKEQKKRQKGVSGIVDSVMGTLASCMTPLIPILLCAGFSKTIAAVFGPQLLGWFSETSDMHTLFTFVGDAGFYFLPVFVGYTAAKRFGVSEVLGLLMGAVMIHPTLVQMVADEASFSVYGIPVMLQNYSSTVIPMVLIVWIMSYVENFFKKITPTAMKVFGIPFGTLLVMLPLSLGVLGPLGGFIGNYVGSGLIALHELVGPLGLAVVGALFSIIVMTGMHPILFTFLIMSFAENGFDTFMMPAMIVSSWAGGGVALACFFKFKDQKKKSNTLGYIFTWLFGGVGEPMLYGLFAQYKSALLASVIGGFIAGLVAGILGLKAYVFNPSNGIYGLAGFFGGDSSNYIVLIISLVVAVVAGFLAMWFMKLEEPEV